MEYRKGILFVRLNGQLDKKTIFKFNKQVISKIEKSGIYNLVLNIENLKEIDLKGINALYYSYELCNLNHGNIFICGTKENDVLKRIKSNRLFNYFKLISNELKAFESVEI